VLRDRARALRLFNFDYRFEAFVPAPQRQYGYYVLPILEGDRLVGRLDPKFNRSDGLLNIRQIYWEPGIRVTLARRRGLDGAVEQRTSSPIIQISTRRLNYNRTGNGCKNRRANTLPGRVRQIRLTRKPFGTACRGSTQLHLFVLLQAGQPVAELRLTQTYFSWI
jgi:hypothetical protein